jgi:hypothetical protein
MAPIDTINHSHQHEPKNISNEFHNFKTFNKKPKHDPKKCIFTIKFGPKAHFLINYKKPSNRFGHVDFGMSNLTRFF